MELTTLSINLREVEKNVYILDFSGEITYANRGKMVFALEKATFFVDLNPIINLSLLEDLGAGLLILQQRAVSVQKKNPKDIVRIICNEKIRTQIEDSEDSQKLFNVFASEKEAVEDLQKFRQPQAKT